MPFQKGNQVSKGKGRPRGAKSKLSESFYQDCLAAYNDPRVGGLEGLIKWLISNQHNRTTFYGWLSKTLPSNVNLGNAPNADGKAGELIVRVIHVKGAPGNGNGNGNGNGHPK